MSPRRKRKERAVDCARKMPALRHSLPGRPFDIRQSAVAQWLGVQPALLQYLFDAAKDADAIVFDPETSTWRGADR